MNKPLDSSKHAKLHELTTLLPSEIRGQSHALPRIISALRRGELGLCKPGRPRGSFLFLGPTGVGKTEVTVVFTDHLFGPGHLFRFDMSEFHRICQIPSAPDATADGTKTRSQIHTHMKSSKLAHVGLRLRALRRHRRKSQHALAAMLQAFNVPISRSMLANWETCRTDISAHFVPFLAYALEANVTELLPNLNRTRAATGFSANSPTQDDARGQEGSPDMVDIPFTQ